MSKDLVLAGNRKTTLHRTAVVAVIASWWLVPGASLAQVTTSLEPSRASHLAVAMVIRIERMLTGVAEEMPADKYGFAPTEGAFRGVRDFAGQIKHAAAVQELVAATLLGERITADMADERGPDTVRTKPAVLEYLKQSFIALKRAAATIDDANAFTPFKGPFPAADSRMASIVAAVIHSANHYGQVVEYLRMNGIVPPPTR